MYKTRRVFSRSDGVSDVNVLVNLEFSDSYTIEASTTANESSEC